ncbi:hypothetical protein [Paenibacillus spiritus]|uniref:hypothetical protein n=1 Tax=Paenibacillus spiritus TaxID=2496557 RepID=UPI00168B8226|nr:hypothetical protein [Paenibacillus spiritus]
MDIHSDSYRVAALDRGEAAVRLIREAEQEVSRLAGRPVTLIAYEPAPGEPAVPQS